MAISLVEALENAGSEKAIRRSFQTFIESLGFFSFTCATLSQPGHRAPGRVLMTTRPAAFLRRYAAGNMHRVDPVLLELKRRQRPFQWSEMISARKLSEAEQDVLFLAAEFGMEDGLAVPIRESNGLLGMVNTGGPPTLLTAEGRAALILGSAYLYQRLWGIQRRLVAPARGITAREAEILSWIASGKSDWQTGQILGISKKTVNYHIENLKRKFGVATRVQAVVAALTYEDHDNSIPVRKPGTRTGKSSSRRTK
jgi:LuxR family quorum sensing-dependent transcriptional regulator